MMPSLRSVVVFIHGGGFILGSGAHPIIAPAPEDFVATNDVVYVTLNYRLGPLGFLVHDSISDSKRFFSWDSLSLCVCVRVCVCVWVIQVNVIILTVDPLVGFTLQ